MFTLKNIYYIPTITKNVISVNQLIQQIYKIIFYYQNYKSYCTIYNPDGNRIISVASNSQNIFNIWLSNYQINFSNTQNKSLIFMNISNINKNEKLNLWYRRLGHFDISPIKNKLLKLNIKQKCPICTNSKLKNYPHRRTINKSKYPFELIHMDLVGPTNESVHGNKYFLT